MRLALEVGSRVAAKEDARIDHSEDSLQWRQVLQRGVPRDALHALAQRDQLLLEPPLLAAVLGRVPLVALGRLVLRRNLDEDLAAYLLARVMPPAGQRPGKWAWTST
eukprot:scaffold47554_cov35-Phaeocystis_antarctica.AAC.3